MGNTTNEEHTPIIDCWDELVPGDIIGTLENNRNLYIVTRLEEDRVWCKYLYYDYSGAVYYKGSHYVVVGKVVRLGAKLRNEKMLEFLFSDGATRCEKEC